MNKLSNNTQSLKLLTLDRKRQVLINALIAQFKSSLIPIESLSLELFKGSGVSSALDYTKNLTKGSLVPFEFYNSAKAPNFILVNDLADYLLSR